MWKLIQATLNLDTKLTRMCYDVSDSVYFIEEWVRASQGCPNESEKSDEKKRKTSRRRSKERRERGIGKVMISLRYQWCIDGSVYKSLLHSTITVFSICSRLYSVHQASILPQLIVRCTLVYEDVFGKAQRIARRREREPMKREAMLVDVLRTRVHIDTQVGKRERRRRRRRRK